MQAIVQDSYNGIDALTLVTKPTPKLLNPLAVRVDTHFTPVMPYDVLTETGQLKQRRPVKLPIVVGYGFGGIVREVGQLRNARFRNQPVIGIQLAGSHQEQLLSALPPLLVPVPQGVSLADATTVIGGADAAYFALKKSRLTAGETVLITGATGSVGTYLVQLARLAGCHVIAVGHSSRHALLTDLGAEHVLDYDRPLEEQLTTTNVDQLIDLAGNTSLLDHLSAELGPANILSLALPDYRPAFPEQSFTFASGAITPGNYRWLLNQLATGALTAVIQERLPFTAVKTAQHHLMTKHSAGRILLTYQQEATNYVHELND
ncbi:quinone oxidoreductase family protein [Levilactobacillus wangkuiensis]|uniref:quinone oxidoreductase family protein n=1 Tax=Levilactobacillus wangkuiensis TaxID=2799566 RepID=UPI0019449C60|nr:zinc-binding dehydrogenase [Levilactobacillus wangkuiensis]